MTVDLENSCFHSSAFMYINSEQSPQLVEPLSNQSLAPKDAGECGFKTGSDREEEKGKDGNDQWMQEIGSIMDMNLEKEYAIELLRDLRNEYALLQYA